MADSIGQYFCICMTQLCLPHFASNARLLAVSASLMVASLSAKEASADSFGNERLCPAPGSDQTAMSAAIW